MLFDFEIKNFNYRLFLYVLLLNASGVQLVGSATNQDASYVNKQIMGIVVGAVVIMILTFFNYRKIISFAPVIYGISLAGLLAVLVSGVTRGGATRWLVLPGIGQVQPSEFAKIGLIVFFAWFLDRNQERINRLPVLASAVGLYLIAFVMIYEQPNLSTSLVTLVIFAALVFAAGISYRWIAGVLAVAVPFGALFVYLLQYDLVPFLRGYQAGRILAFFNPGEYVEQNLQQQNSIMAIGSGMLSGKGLNNNTLASVKNGNFLSEQQTDFIFAVIGEELGFIGCTLVIVMLALVVYECLLMAVRARDMAGRLLCVGIATLLAFQSFANIAVATGMFPNTGLPLPFLSYGVSSLMSIDLGIGLVMNVGMQRRISNY